MRDLQRTRSQPRFYSLADTVTPPTCHLQPLPPHQEHANQVCEANGRASVHTHQSPKGNGDGEGGQASHTFTV